MKDHPQVILLIFFSGGNTWRPSVTPTGSLPRAGRSLGSTPTPVTQTSLKANQQPSRAFGSGHNNVAKPFGYVRSLSFYVNLCPQLFRHPG